MKNEKQFIKIVLLSVGVFGIISTHLFDGALPKHVYEMLERALPSVPPRLLTFLLPLFLLYASINLGLSTYQIGGYKLPIFHAISNKKIINPSPSSLILYSLIGGVICCCFFFIFKISFEIYNQNKLAQLQKIIPLFKNRIFFNAFTEEVIIRFGLVSFFTWVMMKVFKDKTSMKYWIAILVSSFIISLGQSNLIIVKVFQINSNLVFNFFFINKLLSGLIFGWMYWKYGLTVSILSHFLTGLILLILL